MSRRIVILSDLADHGGAAIAANRLADALRQAGDEVIRISGGDGNGFDDGQHRPLRPRPRKLLARVLGRLRPARARARHRVRAVAQQLHRELESLRPDAVSIHNLHHVPGLSHEFTDELVRVVAAHAPVVWTLHDMWSFTGRCTHSFGCQQFASGCTAACPTLDHTPRLDPRRIRPQWERRRRLLDGLPGLTAVSPSRWLADLARAGLWRGHRVEVIANSLSLDTFEPLPRDFARRALGLRAVGPVLLASSGNIGDPRKGGHLLVDMLRALPVRPLTLMTMGQCPGIERLRVDAGVHLHPLGRVSHERARALAFAAADLLVHPSLAENLPNVIAEAHACGTPVAAFRVGGIPEMIDRDGLGRLATAGSAESLAEAIAGQLAAANDAERIREACRATAEARYAPARQAERYQQLFTSTG